MESFKPCYKWNTFNTEEGAQVGEAGDSFKPCYKWNTFNTNKDHLCISLVSLVLNLVISGIPSIQEHKNKLSVEW